MLSSFFRDKNLLTHPTHDCLVIYRDKSVSGSHATRQPRREKSVRLRSDCSCCDGIQNLGSRIASSMISEHAILLKESVADFVSRRMSIARVRTLRNTPLEYDRALWKEIAGLGWLGVSMPEH